jgi:hypothetical protein
MIDTEKDKLLADATVEAVKEIVIAKLGHIGKEELGAPRTFALMIYLIDQLIIVAANLFKEGHKHMSLDDCVAHTIGYAMHCVGIQAVTAVETEETLQ